MMVSGRLTPLRFEILPATSTSVTAAPVAHRLHAQAQLAVVDEDRVAGLQGREDFRMGQVHALGIAGGRVAVEGEGLALHEHGAVARELSDPQLRPLEVGQDGDGPLELGLDARGSSRPARAAARGAGGSC